jgi:transcriptional regulator with XRE-family HTH domain
VKGGDNMNIGERIKQRRKQLKMSADELGKRLGKDRSTIYRYEKGDIENLPLDILEPIAAALHTTPQYLMGWENVQKKNDILSDIILKMNEDMELLSMVETLSKLGFEQRAAVKSVLNAFAITDK